jgi:hypothetical protein
VVAEVWPAVPELEQEPVLEQVVLVLEQVVLGNHAAAVGNNSQTEDSMAVGAEVVASILQNWRVERQTVSAMCGSLEVEEDPVETYQLTCKPGCYQWEAAA